MRRMKTQSNSIFEPKRNSNLFRKNSELSALNPETLSALQDSVDGQEVVDQLISTTNPAIDLMGTLSSTGIILALPILGGIIVASGLGYFIFSWGQGKD